MATDTMLRPGEIKDILLREIEAADLAEFDVEEVGTVLEVKDGVARIYGLEKAMAGEMLEVTSSETGEIITALALNLEEDNIGAVILGDYLAAARKATKFAAPPACSRSRSDPSSSAASSTRSAARSTGSARSTPRHTRKVESEAPGIIVRQPVKEPLQTGIKAIDSMIPIGRGQRELIIGDRGTGKTAIAIDTIINQKGTGVICVYVAIGQKASTVASRREQAASRRARWTTRSSSAPPRPTRRRCSTSRRTRAARWPSTSCITKARRRSACTTTCPSRPPRTAQLSLVLRRPPGREAYPGRRVLSPLASARARGEAQRRSGDRRRQDDPQAGRLDDGAADHRDAGR